MGLLAKSLNSSSQGCSHVPGNYSQIAMMFGGQATKNFIEVTAEQAHDYQRRQTFYVSQEQIEVRKLRF